MNRRLVGHGLAAGALLALAGCHPRRPPPDLSLDPAALLVEVQAAQARVVSVQGRARVGVEAPGGSGGTDQLLVAQRPDRLRIDVQDFFGNVVATLAVADGRLALYDARERTFLRGAATPANLARLVPVAIGPEALVTLLCGSAPLLAGAAAVAAEPGDGSVRLTLRADDRVQRLEVGPGAALLGAQQRRLVAGVEVADGRLALYDARERTFLRGAATPANLARLVPVAIGPEALVTLLCGSAPLLIGATAVAAEPGDGSVRLTLRVGDRVQRLEVGPGAAVLGAQQRRLVAGVEVADGLDAEFTIHRTRAGQRVPTDLSARASAAGVALSLHWRELEVNGPIDASLFRLTPPAGARVVDLDAPPP